MRRICIRSTDTTRVTCATMDHADLYTGLTRYIDRTRSGIDLCLERSTSYRSYRSSCPKRARIQVREALTLFSRGKYQRWRRRGERACDAIPPAAVTMRIAPAKRRMAPAIRRIALVIRRIWYPVKNGAIFQDSPTS